MDKIMEKLNKLSLPIVILIAGIILGGFIYASQINKQKSIEQAEATKQLELSFCLSKADSDYFAYLKLNGTTKTDGSIWTSNYVTDTANKNKQNNKDNCFKQYK